MAHKGVTPTDQVRIVHVVEATAAGVGRHVVDLATEQCHRGYDVHVVYSKLRMGGQFAESVDKLSGIKWHAVDMARGVGVRDLITTYRIRRVLREFRPHVVHGHSSKGGALARLACIGRCDVSLYTPNGFYSLNPDIGILPRLANDFVERLLGVVTTTVLAVSPEEEDHLKSLGFPSRKVCLIPNGIKEIRNTSNSETVRQKLGLRSDRPTVGFVGRLDSQKDPLSLIRIFSRIAKQKEDVQFAVVGAGKLACEAKEFARTFPHLDGKVHWLGQLVGTEVMPCFDVMVLPSRYEGFPYVIIEAASLGIPCVVSTMANASQIIEHSVTGFICERENISDFAEKVCHLLTENGVHQSFSINARSRAKGFTVKRMGASIEKLLSTLLETSLNGRE